MRTLYMYNTIACELHWLAGRDFVNTVSVCALLWLFLLGLKLMGDSFKGIFGTGVRRDIYFSGSSRRFFHIFTYSHVNTIVLDAVPVAWHPALRASEVGQLLSDVLNPMAGLALGVLCTVLLQSSSTTTSIIVSRGAPGERPVRQGEGDQLAPLRMDCARFVTVNTSREATGGLPDHQAPFVPHILRYDAMNLKTLFECREVL